MKTLCGEFLNLAHNFPYDVKFRLLAHSQSFLANQKARNAIVEAENLLKRNNGLKYFKQNCAIFRFAIQPSSAPKEESLNSDDVFSCLFI